MEKRGKKAVSPIVSTSLLIVIVIILAIIIFLWARSFIGEVVEKTIQGVTKSADKFCEEVRFVATVTDDTFYVVNQGDVPIEDVQVVVYKAGESTIKEVTVQINAGTTSDGHNLGDVGLSFSGCSSYERIVIKPILKGKTKSGLKKYTCDKEASSYELPLSEVCS